MKRLYGKILQSSGLHKRYLSYLIILFIDSMASIVCTLASFLVGSWLLATATTPGTYACVVGMSLLFSLAAFYSLSTFKIVIRYSTIKDTLKIGIASVLKCLLLALCCVRLFPSNLNLLWGSVLMDLLLTTVVLISLRAVMVFCYDTFLKSSSDERRLKNVFIFGIGDKSVAMMPLLAADNGYRLQGFICFGSEQKIYRPADKKVFYFNTREEFDGIAERYGIDAVIFPDYETVQDEKERLIRYCEARKIKTLIVPPVTEVSGNHAQGIREVKIEDLLGRQEIKINLKEIQESFRGKTILVTGAAGSIGSELCRQLTNFDIERLILFDSAETPLHNFRLELEERFPHLDFVPVIGDVRIRSRVDVVFRRYHPQIIFHAAAYKHVPLMETNPCEAIMANVGGSRNVADLAVEYGAEKMVMVSTDKAVNPTNMMGASKRLAEIYIQSLGVAIEQGRVSGKTRFVTTRFGNVLGSNGSVIPLFRQQIEKGGPVTVTHPDIIRFFMTIPEATRLVLEAASMSTGNEIFVFDMGEPVKIVNLARRMIELAGFTPDKDIKIEFSGLRPGEKLYEEVLSSLENTVSSSHDKIRIAMVRENEYEAVRLDIMRLLRVALRGQIEETVIMTKRLIPEYKSQNSYYEKYDKPEVAERVGEPA